MIIKVMAKKITTNKNGNYGMLLCYAYHDESFEGFPVSSIWIPTRTARPENIKVGQICELKIHEHYAVKLKPFLIGKGVE